MKKPYLFLLSAVFLCVILVLAFTIFELGKKDRIVMEVNGEPVTKEEFSLFMEKEKSAVRTYFKIKYDVEDQENYWIKVYHGESPLENLKKRGYEQCIEAKVLQILAKEHGLIDDISFDALVKSCDEYNKKQKTGKIISGLGAYSLKDYYDYYMSNLRLELEEQLAATVLLVSEDEIREYYDSNPDLYKNKEEVKVGEVYFSYNIEDKKEIYAKAAKAKQMLEKGTDFSELCQKYNSDGIMHEATFLLTEEGSQLKSNKEILEAVREMSVGGYSEVLDQGSGYSILKLLSHTTDSEYSFSAMKEQIRDILTRQKFEAYLEEQLRNSSVQINQRVYKRITIK